MIVTIPFEDDWYSKETGDLLKNILCATVLFPLRTSTVSSDLYPIIAARPLEGFTSTPESMEGDRQSWKRSESGRTMTSS